MAQPQPDDGQSSPKKNVLYSSLLYFRSADHPVFVLFRLLDETTMSQRRGRGRQRPSDFLSMAPLCLGLLCIAGVAGGERDGGDRVEPVPTTTTSRIWPEIATNDEIPPANKCAGHMTKSKSCGANTNKYGLLRKRRLFQDDGWKVSDFRTC